MLPVFPGCHVLGKLYEIYPRAGVEPAVHGDALLPSAGCNLPQRSGPGQVCVMREEIDGKEKGEMTRMDFRQYLYTFRMILFYAFFHCRAIVISRVF